MAHYTNEVFQVEFDYPDTWVRHRDPGGGVSPVEDYSDPRGTEFGFFNVNVCCGGQGTLDDVAKLDAEHKFKPFGEEPRILSLTLPAGEARLILPDERATDNYGAELIIRYPPSFSISDFYAFFLLRAHEDYIQKIASTLRLTGTSTTPTP